MAYSLSTYHNYHKSSQTFSPSRLRDRNNFKHTLSSLPLTLSTMLCCLTSIPKDRAVLTVRLSLRTALLASILFLCLALCSVFINRLSLQATMQTITTTTNNNISQQSSSYSSSTSKTNLVAVEDIELIETHRKKQQELYEKFTSDLPKCSSKGRAKTFLLVFMGHSGSTALMTSLKQHSNTLMYGLEPVDHGKFVAGESEYNANLALNYTGRFFQHTIEKNLTGGFKIRPRQILKKPKEFGELIKKYDTRIIWSYRTNIMKQAIGDYTIHHYGDRSAYEGLKVNNNSTNKQSVELNRRMNRSFNITNMKKLHEMMKSRISGDEEISRALRFISRDSCVLPVSYESYLRRPELTLARVQQFLGLGTEEMHPALRQKANQDSLCDLVDNWQDVCEAFFGCVQWRWMMDDFENGCSCSSLKPSRFKSSSPYCSL